MSEMKTDANTLRTEAANFDQIADELQQIIRMVESVGKELSDKWRGRAGAAAQQALERFREAGQAQIKALSDTASNIHDAGFQYSKADDHQATVLATQMKFS